MFGLLTSVLSGGLTGILGAGLQRFADFMNKKQDIAIMKMKFENELAMRRIDGEMMDKEWAARTKVAEVEGAAATEVAKDAAFGKSFAMEPKMYSADVKPGAIGGGMLIFLDFIRGIVRPGLTIYLCVLTTMIYFQARAVLADKPLSPQEALTLTATIVDTILYLFTSVVMWFFGVRNTAKQPGAK